MSTYDWKRQRAKLAYLALENGEVFHGYSIGANRDVVGESVFNTGMTGYQEILSDPSYSGQLVCLTAPEVGNYGVNAADMESRGFFLSGLVVNRTSDPSNWRSDESLADALVRRNVPAIAGIDCRALTATLRDRGSQKAFLCVSGEVPEGEGIARAGAWEGLEGRDYVQKVTCGERYEWDSDNRLTATYPLGGYILPPAEFAIVAYDFGVKWNILRGLRRTGMQVTVVPADTPAEDVLALKPDGVFLSNGPADPAGVLYAAKAVEKLLGRVPIMGICLGHQLLGLARGGKTYKLPFGHHGCNHPVKDLVSGRTLITSQNHNFAVDAESLDASRDEVTHISLNDQSLEGFRCRDVPAFSVQFHPEAAPGPHDANPLFESFRSLIESAE
ncbi:MAG: glutamine-hydrolyzing carbamoyl-phosphate synthase small subunit [Planctomycetota bacterium]|jgi:carbamoyl-phosphate synthase small subunit|nr:glutamine-hydrolyzing carbamoyl-phosphate synthase small subunit [Planctomycetota bacterium]